MLKKVIIYSRHGLRYPLFNYEELDGIITKEDINWDFEGGILTPKGEKIEYQFGQYLRKYIKNLDINIKSKEFYSNSMRRTYLTAKILALSMFPFENIEVGHKYDVFDTIEDRFDVKIEEKNSNKEKLQQLDDHLRKKYNKIEEMLNIKKDKIYSDKSTIYYEDGVTKSKGAFKIATDIVDLFILKYYEGFNLDDIYKSDNLKEEIKYLSEIKDMLLDNIFGDIEYIKNSEKNCYKMLLDFVKSDKDLSVIVGHDANIATILTCLGLQNIKIGNDFEKYPIGSKLVFKIYDDNKFDLDMLYYDVETIRNFENNEPQCVSLGKGLTFKEIL